MRAPRRPSITSWRAAPRWARCLRRHVIVAERFFDESGGMQLVIHAPFGARINKAWGLALRKRFCRSFNFELQAAATDNGLNISLGEQHSFPLGDVFHYLQAASVKEVLEQAVLAAPLFTVRWRWAAGRSLALLRFQGGKKVPPQIQRMRADDLLAAVFPQAIACQENIVGDIEIPDHPAGARDDERRAHRGAGSRGPAARPGRYRGGTHPLPGRGYCRCPRSFRTRFSTPIPTPISTMRRSKSAALARWRCAAFCRRTLASEIGRLDPSAIAEVRADAWPDVRDADELHDALLTLVAVPESERAGGASASAASPLQEALARSIPEWRVLFAELAAQQRATRALHAGRDYWVSAERAQLFRQIFAGAEFASPLPEVGEAAASPRMRSSRCSAAGWPTRGPRRRKS